MLATISLEQSSYKIFLIAFYSRKLNPVQRNYTVMEKELLFIIESLDYFRNILIVFKIIIHSDHKNLSFNNFRSERVRRWRLLLEEYDYTFTYTSGKNNFIADLLSRYPTHPIPSKDTEVLILDHNDNNNGPVCPVDYAIIAQHQANDASLQALLVTPNYEQLNVNGESIIFHNNKICIPSSLIVPSSPGIMTYLTTLGPSVPTKPSPHTSTSKAWKRALNASLVNAPANR